MIIFKPHSLAWMNARKAFLKEDGDYSSYNSVYDGYREWVRQFGGNETSGGLVFNNDRDALVFTLRFG